MGPVSYAFGRVGIQLKDSDEDDDDKFEGRHVIVMHDNPRQRLLRRFLLRL
jgi:hypothetical protein